MYDIQMKEYGEIKYPHTFDKKVFPISEDYMFKYVPDIKKKNKRKLLQYLDLLPVVKDEDGSLSMSIYGMSRIEFINKLIEKWKYDYPILKEIIQWEEDNIDKFYTANDLAYDDVESELSGFNKLEYYTTYHKKVLRTFKRRLKNSNRFNEKKNIGKSIKNVQHTIREFSSKTYDDLTDKEKEDISRDVFMMKWMDELLRDMAVNRNRAQIILGFSPDIYFKKYGARINNDNYGFGFGDWDFFSIDHSFFSTPELLIIEKEGGEFVITIRDPQKVNVRYMRRIEKAYNSMRKKKKYPTSSWGEKSGKKRLIRERNKILQMHYRQLSRSSWSN